MQHLRPALLPAVAFRSLTIFIQPKKTIVIVLIILMMQAISTVYSRVKKLKVFINDSSNDQIMTTQSGIVIRERLF